MAGCLLMLPVPISDSAAEEQLPSLTIETARRLDFFLAENAKSARAFLKKIGHPKPIAELSIVEIGHRPDPSQINKWLEPLAEGHDVGIVSEAGCPGIADPGAQVAQKAQEMNYRVRPLVGPCSMILALMASGMDGQNFRFCGYLPIKEPERSKAIKELEKRSSFGSGETQLFIETPYRNNQMLKDLLSFCGHQTQILVAMDITGPNEYIKTKTAEQWKKENPVLPKLPSIFGILSPKKPERKQR